ncbi:MAG TPA: tetratricopeptide repeat protein [Rectinemataceae bacterium]|nr:tetratricopeptide repeat protein [Rectinemataceae bacterium]
MRVGRLLGLACGGCILLATLGFSSCTLPGDFGAVVEGNARFRKGHFEAAAASYLSVHTPSWRGAVDFDLANTWARLGEERAAERLYAIAVKEGHGRLKRDSWYNLGLLRLELGRWEESWKAFREALRLDSGDVEARRGLEIAWKAWKKEASSAPSLPAPAVGTAFDGVVENLELLRRLETGSWRPGSGPASTGETKDW